ncbi:ketoacyl-ACP synthase III [bacterium]|nr:ketoacyl-ACP synthase III [bacterium]
MYAPDKVVPNTFFNEILGEDVDTWLRENLTIRERRWCSEDESTADLVERAAKITLEHAGLTPADLDLFVVATDTPEWISPSTASIVQHRLGAVNAGTFDLNTACAGFVTALDMGAKYIQADERYKRVMIVGAYAMSKYLDVTDKKTANLFADGAGAVILEATDDSSVGWQASQLHTEGQYATWMGIYAGGTAQPITHDVVDNKDHLLKFVKRFPTEINPDMWSKMITESLARIGKKPSDVAQYCFTQININGIRATLDILGEPYEKAHTVMDRYGYTGSACIPMVLAEVNEQGKLNDGDLVVFMGSGGGLAFACSVFVWG